MANGKIVLAANPDGSVFLIDYIDSFKNASGEDNFNGVKLQYKLVKQSNPTPNPEPTQAPTPTPEPTPAGAPTNLVKATLRGKKITL